MKKILSVLLLFSVAVLLLSVGGCSKNPPKLTVEDVTVLAQAYFSEQHGLDVTVISVSYERVGQYDYLNKVTASDGELEYRLFLDRHNKPASDDVSAALRISSINASSYDEILASLGLARLEKIYGLVSPEYNGIGFTLSGIEYGVGFSVRLIDRDKCSRDGIYSLLGVLRDDGIDDLIIGYIEPKPNNSGFYTDMDRVSFNEEYDSFIEKIQ